MLPTQEIESIISFIKETYAKNHVSNAVIAVSGGIDSALSLTLLCKALGTEHVFAVLLPYNTQSTDDALQICRWNNLTQEHIFIQNIGAMADTIIDTLEIPKEDITRRGNIMARVRMVVLYDYAKKQNALVCGTENKSEMYLGYFTRFGDEASDIEPIRHLTKTHIREISKELTIPQTFIEKSPSAELWENQTDEHELGFTYEDGDKVIEEYIKMHGNVSHVKDVSDEIVQKVLSRITSQEFKHHVPYFIHR